MCENIEYLRNIEAFHVSLSALSKLGNYGCHWKSMWQIFATTDHHNISDAAQARPHKGPYVHPGIWLSEFSDHPSPGYLHVAQASTTWDGDMLSYLNST